MLRVSNVSATRSGKLLFEGISFDLAKGEVLQIKGPNGSGKSSLAAIISGDFQQNSGMVECKFRIGVLLQNIEIDFPITVAEFVALGDKKGDVAGALVKLRISELSEKLVTELSVGQLQRVELAQLLLQNPELYILDEPFSAQDSENITYLIGLLKELKSTGKSIILINHIELDLIGLVDQTLQLQN